MKDQNSRWRNYWISGVALIVITTYICTAYFTLDNTGIILVSLGVMVVHFIVYVLALSIMSPIVHKGFNKENNRIIEIYNQHRNHNKFIADLKAMNPQPKTEYEKNVFNLNMATAHTGLGNKGEAKRYIALVKPRTQAEVDIIDNLNKQIEKKR